MDDDWPFAVTDARQRSRISLAHGQVNAAIVALGVARLHTETDDEERAVEDAYQRLLVIAEHLGGLMMKRASERSRRDD